MAEIGFEDLGISFGAHPLLEGAALQVEKGERIGLLGRNGCGKSTLLRILAGQLEPDHGSVQRRKGVSVADLPQEVPRDLTGTVRELIHRPLEGVEAHGAWENESRIDRIAKKLQLDPDAELSEQSAGTKRRALLARALVQEADVLLLDEPTNHLDIEAVGALEELLLRHRGSLIFVTHDRAFLRRLATRIVDLDRGKLASYECNYETFLKRKESVLEAEANQNAEFDKKLAIEETWMKRGIKARRTRNMGRVRALQSLREERAQRVDPTGKTRALLQQGGRSGRLVLRATKIAHTYGGPPLIRELSTDIMRGDRVGIIGANGTGKTTLVRILLEELTPTEGEIRHGTNLEIGRFDQLHDLLDPTKSVRENVCDYGDFVTIDGNQRHIIGYLGDFLFSPDQIQGPITKLSGGERNRLQLAKLLARPANLLVLDEPTNDLDLETLELLETLLVEYQGTLLIVSHDREFLDNVVSSVLVFEGDGRIGEYVGGYSDWLKRQEKIAPPSTSKAKAKAKKLKPAATSSRRLTFTEMHELKDLPDKLEALESEQASLMEAMASPGFFKKTGEAIAADKARLAELEGLLAKTYERWESLETIAQESGQAN